MINNLSACGFTLANRTFETIGSVSHKDIEDDRLGTFKPAFADMGNTAPGSNGRHQDERIFSLLKDGFTSLCLDGQNFFDTDHPVIGDDGVTKTTVANTDGGARAPDQSGQERVKYAFQSITALTRSSSMIAMSTASGCWVNAGFGLWQLA